MVSREEIINEFHKTMKCSQCVVSVFKDELNLEDKVIMKMGNGRWKI